MGYTKPSYITVPFGHTALTPWVVSSTYYFGNSVTLPTTNANIKRVYIPLKGVVRGIVFYERCTTTAGSAEAWPMVLRINDTTDYAIDSQSVSSNDRIWSNYTMMVPVNASDYFEIKTVTPAWATPPSDGGTGAGFGVVLIEAA